MVQKHVYGQRSQTGTGKRQHNLHELPEMSASVYFCRIKQFMRELKKKLSKQKHPKRSGHKRHHQSLVKIHSSQFLIAR